MSHIKDYHLYACLPFLELESEKPINIGPVAFFSGAQAEKCLDPEVSGYLSKYLKGHQLNEKKVTCISIHPDIKEKHYHWIVVDAIYILYFVAYYREIYDLLEAPDMHPFTKFIPAEEKYLRKVTEQELAPLISVHETKISLVDEPQLKLCEAFSKVIGKEEAEKSSAMRSLRFFVDGLMRKFENIASAGLKDLPRAFHPELIIFLMTAYDTLFHIEQQSSPSDLKQILRPMLKLKYSRSVELLWSWVDGLYKHFSSAVHGGEESGYSYTANKSLKLSYLRIGLKVYIYSMLHKLFELGLIEPTSPEEDTPLEFLEISPKEILLLLWSQEDILKKLSILLMQITEGKNTKEYRQDAKHLAELYNLYNVKFSKPQSSHIHYNPPDPEAIESYVKAIKNLSTESIEVDGSQVKLSSTLPTSFWENV